MKPALSRLLTAVLCGGCLLANLVPPMEARTRKASSVPTASSAARAQEVRPVKAGSPPERVLDAMDQQAQGFSSVQADVLWDQYEAPVDEHTLQSGTMWVLKKTKNLEMAVDLWPGDKGSAAKGDKNAAEKYVVFSNGKVQVFQPKTNQVTEYDTGKKRQAFESMLVLGFGGGGHSLQEQFEVRYLGGESLKGVGTDRQMQEGAAADRLELTPKSNEVGRVFQRIELWIDSAGICLQQKFHETSSGNYRLVRYTHIKANSKIHDDVFRLKTNGSTQYIRQ